MADEPAQPPRPNDSRTFLDTLPHRHREALISGMEWLLEDLWTAIMRVEMALPMARGGILADLPQRWRRNYDDAFVQKFTVCAIVVGIKLRVSRVDDGYFTSCVAEELALELVLRRAEASLREGDTEFYFEALREGACTDRNYDCLYYTGQRRPTERSLAEYGMWKRDLRYLALFRPFADAVPPLHPWVDPTPEWWKATPEPVDDEE
jgi:hypothetical protein